MHSKNNNQTVKLSSNRWKQFVRTGILFISWTIYGLFMSWEANFAALRANEVIPFGSILFREMVYAYLWMILTPLVFSIVRRFPLDSKRWIIHACLHIIMSFGLALIHKSLFLVIEALYNAAPGHAFSIASLLPMIPMYIDYGITIYWVLLLIHYAFAYYRSFKDKELLASQLETELARAQLQALKMQLHPHFLFNTLNGISVLMQKDTDTARRMIGKLAELLRLVFSFGSVHTVSLRQELEILDLYLQLEQMRFTDRLEVRMSIAPETLDAIIPTLILQPLVENAMRHGVARNRGNSIVEIRSAKSNNNLELQVRDNGPGVPDTGRITEGIGLSNTRSRLERLYGNLQQFEVASDNGNGFAVKIILPFQTENNQLNNLNHDD